MALKLENTFVVAAPIGPTWRTLLDLPGVAGCLPGATIEPGEEEGTYAGSMRVKLGPVTMSYSGVARITEVDEATRTAVLSVQGRETRGQGTASATITNRLVEQDGGTQVTVETELSVTGRPAQFGRGIMEDVASSMLADFARCLSETIARAGSDGAAPAPTGVPDSPASAAGPERRVETLDLTGTVGGVLRRQLARITGIAALGRVIGRVTRRGAPRL
jgi:carbon monoxide dehydrogenase subunit G